MKEFFVNHKKVIFIVLGILAFLLIVGGVVLYFLFFYEKKSDEKKFTYTEQISYLGDFSVMTNDVFGFEIQEEVQDYELALYSEEYNSSIYVSAFDSSRVRSIEDVINSDKDNFSAKFQNFSNLSELDNFDISGFTVYEYHFLTPNRYVQNYYIVYDNKVYVFDFDIDINGNYEYNLKDFTREIVESFKILEA